MTNAVPPQQSASLTVVQALQQAIAHHQAGRLQDAERLYRAILQTQSNHPDANHNLGVLAVQVKQPAAGLPHLKAALEANPNQGQYWLSYMDALIQTGQADAARQVLTQGRQRGLNGEAVEALAGRLEGGAEIAAQSNTDQPTSRKQRDPSPQEINALVALFNEGRYAEAETLARTMTERFPLHGFGWKVLGAVFKQMGRSADALEPMQKAAALSPGDADAHSNLGVTLRDLGRLDEAEASYRCALGIEPDSAEVHSNLGVLFLTMGRLDEAEANYRQALQIKPDYADAHYALGNTLRDMERLDEADTSYRQALQLKPDYARAHNNLGNTLRELGRLDEAEASCRQALQIRPDYPGAYSNLGVILFDRGLLAEASYRRALEIQPDFDEALFNLGHLFRFLDDMDQATAIYQKVLDVAPLRKLDAAVYLAILYYLDGKTEPCRSMLLASNAIVENPGLEHKNLGVYWRYLDKLMSSHRQPDQRQIQNRAPLYVVGESHSLCAHGVVVRHDGQDMRCTAEWIEGCKQWHLGNGKPNKYKHKFEAVMARLPRQSTILSLIGEIDCRHDEGIIKAWHKFPDKKLEEIAQATASAYVAYVGRIAAQYGHRMIVGGVPATNMQLDTLTAASAEQFVELIRTFNALLKKEALAAGMDFLDIHALTDRGDGIATGEWHIDNHHLFSDAVAEAFDLHCIRGDVRPVSTAVSQGGKKTPKAKPAKKHVSQKNPGHQEMNALVALFNSGRFAEAETLVRLMTARYPLHGFGWKVLGAVLTQLGRSADALEAMQKAAALSPGDAEAHYNLGITLGGLGRLAEAEASYRRTLEIRPDYAEAHGNLGVLLKGMSRLHEAEVSYRRALEIKPDLAEVQNNLGNTLKELGRLEEAEVSFRRALQIKPDYVEAHSNLGNTLHAQGRLDEAETSYRRALQIKPDYAEAHSNLGNTLKELGRLDEAEASYRRALQIQPNLAEAHNNLANILQELGLLDEAETSCRLALQIRPDYAGAHYNLGNVLLQQRRYEDARTSYQKVLSLEPDYAEAHSNLGITLHDLGRLDEAEVSFRHALQIKPDYAEAHSNLGNILKDMGRLDEAEAHCRRALQIKPDYAEAHSNLGNILKDMGRLDEAEAHCRRALQIKPDFPGAHYNLGNVLLQQRRYEDARTSYQKVLSLEPDYGFALGQFFYSKQHCCEWEGFEATSQALLDGIDSGKTASAPFPLLATPSLPEQQKRCAEVWMREKYPEVHTPPGITNRYFHDKIRLGYFSSDFYNHATAYLMTELLEQHDRSRFEVIGFSFGVLPNDNMRQRISVAFDRFIDVNNQSDQDIATLARNLEIDIAVDLKGFTEGARTGIFALYPAPIQVSYLGYPGTMGTPCIDYLIADPTLIPVDHQQCYTEKIAYLPDTYQVNDSHRRISERQFTRSEAGLPDEGFVFCCFNNNFKITPTVFDIWMQLLKQVEGSVLWLFEGNAQAKQNLRNEAMKRGIAPVRIVFAQRMDLPDHLARHRLADLFLDTFFYNAHTTASDALWAGLPVLTYLGDTFAGRVAASLLNAIGLPELITHSHEEYKSLALELATSPEKLASIKQRLAKNRTTHPLFNTVLFTQHIEDAFTQMWKKHQESLSPEHIYVRANK